MTKGKNDFMQLKLRKHILDLPVFFPDATHAVIRGMSPDDLIGTNTQGLVVNTFHFLVDGIIDVVEKSGGVSSFMNVNLPVISDSGGFQAMSLVRRGNNGGKLTDNGVVFKNFKNGSYLELTPENCIETQLKIGSDILMCLDDCTDPHENIIEQEKSIERTIKWAKRCRARFDELTGTMEKAKPLLFAIIQGGNHQELRKQCADELIKLNFDGYAYGGWPMFEGTFMEDILRFTAYLMPDDKPKYAMGVGKPEDVRKGIDMGYNMFDCVLPTRDARHGRLYVWKDAKNGTQMEYEFLAIGSGQNKHDLRPVSDECRCITCQKYTRAYLHHLFKISEPSYYRLATIHNLFFYADYMNHISLGD